MCRSDQYAQKTNHRKIAGTQVKQCLVTAVARAEFLAAPVVMLNMPDRRGWKTTKKPGHRPQSWQLSGAVRVRNRHYGLGENSHWGARRSPEENRIDGKTNEVMKDHLDLLEV